MSTSSNESFIKQDTALESMRASDFDCYSAYSEVIDNSIQANASKISIIFESKKDRNKDSQKIGRMIFLDNGDGMDVDTLHKCLKLGHSSRYNDRNGIGRFGVGMTLGAIHECRKIEVYSKTEDTDWHYTYMDLDEISSGELEYLPYPVKKIPSIPNMDFIGKSGTIVIWTKYDKQIGSFDNIIKESKIYFGRVFRKFIWGIAKGYGEVNLLVNGESVKAIDPLYVTKSKTGFEGETSAALMTPQNIKWPITKNGQASNQKSNISIDISLLPEEYRSRQGAGGSAHAKERFIDRNEGISILRNDREVFYGHIPYGKSRSTFQDEKNRFIGCEINFNAELDDWFSVKNIKRGAVPIRDLKDKIIELIRPTLRTKQSIISDFWKQQEEEIIEDTENEGKENGVSSGHSETNAGLRDLDHTKFPKTPEEIESPIEDIISIFIGELSDVDSNERFVNFFEKSKLIVDNKPAHGNNFMSMLHSNGSSTLLYNSNSIFFKVYEEIQEKGAVSSSDFKVFIDLILIAFLFAEKKIDPEENLDGKDFCEDIKENWANQLTKLFRAWYSKK